MRAQTLIISYILLKFRHIPLDNINDMGSTRPSDICEANANAINRNASRAQCVKIVYEGAFLFSEIPEFDFRFPSRILGSRVWILKNIMN